MTDIFIYFDEATASASDYALVEPKSADDMSEYFHSVVLEASEMLDAEHDIYRSTRARSFTEENILRDDVAEIDSNQRLREVEEIQGHLIRINFEERTEKRVLQDMGNKYLFGVLGISSQSSTDALRQVYLVKADEFLRQDLYSEFCLLTFAYEYLSDPERAQQHAWDRTIDTSFEPSKFRTFYEKTRLDYAREQCKYTASAGSSGKSSVEGVIKIYKSLMRIFL